MTPRAHIKNQLIRHRGNLGFLAFSQQGYNHLGHATCPSFHLKNLYIPNKITRNSIACFKGKGHAVRCACRVAFSRAGSSQKTGFPRQDLTNLREKIDTVQENMNRSEAFALDSKRIPSAF
jgi:hypothetical protein